MNQMKQSLLRGLDASGLTVQATLKYKYVEVLSVIDDSGNHWLIIKPRPLFTTWPNVHHLFASEDYAPQLIKVSGEVLVAVTDSEAARNLLASFYSQIAEARKSEVFLENQGFTKTRLAKRLELKHFLGPLAALAVPIMLPIVMLDKSEPIAVDQGVVECDVKISPDELARFVESKLDSLIDLKRFGRAELTYEQASLKLESGVAIGGVAELAASLSCPNGDRADYKFRYDTLGGGALTSIASN